MANSRRVNPLYMSISRPLTILGAEGKPFFFVKFFIPYETILFHEYGTAILVYVATLFLNLFAAAFVLNRKFFLKDTGRRLSDRNKQLHVGQIEVRAPSLEEEVD